GPGHHASVRRLGVSIVTPESGENRAEQHRAVDDAPRRNDSLMASHAARARPLRRPCQLPLHRQCLNPGCARPAVRSRWRAGCPSTRVLTRRHPAKGDKHEKETSMRRSIDTYLALPFLLVIVVVLAMAAANGPSAWANGNGQCLAACAMAK